MTHAAYTFCFQIACVYHFKHSQLLLTAAKDPATQP